MRQLRAWLPVAVVATAAAMVQFVRLRQWRDFAGTPLTFDVFWFALLLLGVAWWAVPRFRWLGRAGWVAFAAFLLLLQYALYGAGQRPGPVVETSRSTEVPLPYLTSPAMIAALAAAAALAVALVLARRRGLVVVIFATLAVAGFLAWPRQIPIHRSWRLASALAGSASIHVVYLLVAAVGLGWWLLTRPRRGAWGGAAVAALGVVGVLASGSRGGLLALATWVVLAGVAARTKTKSWRPIALGVAGLVAAWVALLLIVPDLRHSLSSGDPLRELNAQTALAWWGSSSETMLWGTGYGQVWPWAAFDSGLIPAPGERMVPTAHGSVLLSPHSTALAVLVELGLVGALLALVVVAAVVRLWWTSRNDPFAFPIASALVASLVAFLFDTYLLKEFGVSFWWWLALFLVACAAPASKTIQAR